MYPLYRVYFSRRQETGRRRSYGDVSLMADDDDDVTAVDDSPRQQLQTRYMLRPTRSWQTIGSSALLGRRQYAPRPFEPRSRRKRRSRQTIIICSDKLWSRERISGLHSAYRDATVGVRLDRSCCRVAMMDRDSPL